MLQLKKLCVMVCFIMLCAVFCMTAAWCRRREQPTSYEPVAAVTMYYNVMEIGSLNLREGDRVLVPRGEYEGLWRVRLSQWVRAEASVPWRDVTDLRTFQRFTFNGERWLAYTEEVLGHGEGVLEVSKDGQLAWRERTLSGTHHVHNLCDGAYTLYQGGSVYPAVVLQGQLMLPPGIQAGKTSHLLPA